MAIYDKLSVINSALSRTGNSMVALNDGSAEWIVASDAYETELPMLIESHDWGFARNFDSLTRIGASKDPNYAYAYARPADCLHLIDVTLTSYSIDYGLVGDTIVVCRTGTSTDPFTANNPVAEYIRVPLPSQWPELFIETLRQRIMSHAYRGLNEDVAEADRIYQKSEETLMRARSRTDQQERPVKRLLSGMAASRRYPKIYTPYRGS